MPSKNEVATIDQTTTAAAVYQGPVETGLEEMDAGDLIIPRMSITQPTSPDIDAANQGKFLVNITGDFQETMTAVLIKLSKSRILFPEKYKRDNEPLCRSHDFKVPANDIPGATPMAESCALLPLANGEKKQKHACPYANWTVDDKGKPVPPRCQETWNTLIVDLESYMPMFFSLKSAALKPLRKIVSAISMIARAKNVPMWSLKFDMAIEKVTNDSGTFYIPTFNGLSALEKDDAENMAAIRQQLAGVNISENDAEPEAPTEAGKTERDTSAF